MKNLVVFAGPNGSGKSTVTKGFLDPSYYSAYVNADIIQSQLGLTELEAAQKAEAAREILLAQGQNFAFETVLSTATNFDLLIRAKAFGYHITCYYVLTIDPKINIERVTTRFQAGGHNVSATKVYHRYIRALTLMPILFSICDEVQVFDNSVDSRNNLAQPIVICSNHNIVTYPSNIWSSDMLHSLLVGKYPTDYIFTANR